MTLLLSKPVSESTMAPPSGFTVDLTDLIIRNCQAFNHPSVNFQVITRLDPSNDWHAQVLKTDNGKCSLFISASSPSHQRALELLHEKTSRSIDQFIIYSGGFYQPQDPVTIPVRPHLRGGDARATKPSDVSVCGTSDSEVSDSSDSDNDDAHRVQPRSGRLAGPLNKRRSRLDAPCNSDTDLGHSRRRSAAVGQPQTQTQSQRPVKVNIPQPAARHSALPTWNMPLGNPPPIPIQLGPQPARPPPPPVCRIPPPPLPQPMPPQNTMPALVNITWPGRGFRNMVVHTAPSIQSLQQMAANEAHKWPMGFKGPQQLPPASRPNNYQGRVRRVTLGEDTYDVSGFGDDLSTLFRSSHSIPKFDIDIVPYPDMFHVIPSPRSAPASSLRSEPELLN